MADTGWLDFTTITREDRAGSVNEYGWWRDSTTAYADEEDGTYARTDSFLRTGYTPWLRFVNVSGLSIPVGSTIDGIEVRIKRKGLDYTTHNSDIRDSVLRLHVSGTMSGDDNADTDTTWPTSNAFGATVGGPTDDWNAGYDRADLIGATFGVQLSVANVETVDAYGSAFVDVLQIKIYYTVPGEL